MIQQSVAEMVSNYRVVRNRLHGTPKPPARQPTRPPMTDLPLPLGIGQPISLYRVVYYGYPPAPQGGTPRIASVKEIQLAVCRHYGTSLNELTSVRRQAGIVWSRQVAMYLAKTITSRSLPEIGRLFGGRDHTTVLHAVRKIEGLVQNSTDLSDTIMAIKADLMQQREVI